jgi:hypothetical protein
MITSGCAERKQKLDAPKAPEHGELVEFLSTSGYPFAGRQSTGFLIAPSPTTAHSKWLHIGEQCQDSTCKGFGRLSGPPDIALKAKFKRNINIIISKVDGNRKKWGVTKLGDIKLCDCAATTLPALSI